MPVIQCNGAELYYEDHGVGQPIVFLHGGTAGLRYFEPQLMGLSDEYRTIAVDFRGHGRSEKTELGHTFDQYAHDVQTFLEQLELDRVVLVGGRWVPSSRGNSFTSSGPTGSEPSSTSTWSHRR
jgi:pimeloyl-ACP methyl ester carboxylesterase